jgi:hypothetical protein
MCVIYICDYCKGEWKQSVTTGGGGGRAWPALSSENQTPNAPRPPALYTPTTSTLAPQQQQQETGRDAHTGRLQRQGLQGGAQGLQGPAAVSAVLQSASGMSMGAATAGSCLN